MVTVILFGGGLQSLSIARGLKEKGYRIINIAGEGAVGKYSKYIDSFFTISLLSLSPDFITDIINKSDAKIIIPLEDEFAEWLSHYKSRIEELSNCKVAIEKEILLQKVINKNTLLTFCQNHNIPHPVTIDLTSEHIESDCLKNFNFPALIKPNISNGSRGIIKINNYTDLQNHLERSISEFGPCTLQEFIENDHYYNVMLYRYKNGAFAPAVVTKITRFYPINGGSSSFCTTIENESLCRLCKDLLNKLNWVGFADFDVLEKNTGDYRIIEINPRIPASVHASYISGIDFGAIIVEDLLNVHKTEMKYNPGKSLRCLGLDIAWFISSPKRFSANPSWFKFWGKNLSYQEGGRKDLTAMLYSIWCGIKKQLSPSFRKAKAGMN